MALDQLDNACFNSGISERLGGMPASNPGAPLVMVVCQKPKIHPKKWPCLPLDWKNQLQSG
jgi:hypothetical protein